jgi:hypothetical protein
MAGNIRWEGDPGALTSYLGAELNSLADGAIDSSGGVIDNEDANYDTHMDLELYLASVDLSGQTNPTVYIHKVESVDGGTNYHDEGTDATTTDGLQPTDDTICAALALQIGSGAQIHIAVRTMIPIGPCHFKLVIRNETGAAFAASGNTLKYRTYQIGYT